MPRPQIIITPKLVEMIRQGLDDHENGRVIEFESAEELNLCIQKMYDEAKQNLKNS